MSHRMVQKKSVTSSFRTCLLLSSVIVIFILYSANNQLRYHLKLTEIELDKFTTNMYLPLWAKSIDDFEGFDNNTGTETGCYLVPNVVHFIKLNERKFSFIEMICVVAAFKKQRPEILYIHTNMDTFVGKYWDILKKVHGIFNVLYVRKISYSPLIGDTSVPENYRKSHISDVMRLSILMEFGGIFLNTDMYLVRDLNDFRRFEITVSWKYGKTMGNQIMIAHKDARFLKEYLLSYTTDYNPNSLVYNSAVKPTKEILNRKPYYVHRVEKYLGTYVKVSDLYLTIMDNWRDYYSLSLSADHQFFLQTVNKNVFYPVEFEDYNVGNYTNITFYELVNDVFDIPKKRIR